MGGLLDDESNEQVRAASSVLQFSNIPSCSTFLITLLFSTTSSAGSNNPDTDFHQSDERRLRDVIKHLKSTCSLLQNSMLELESVHSVTDAPRDVTSSRVMSTGSAVDLEQAVLVQELMAMKVRLNYSLSLDISLN